MMIYVSIPEIKKSIHIPVSLENIGVHSFFCSFKKELIPGIIPSEQY